MIIKIFKQYLYNRYYMNNENYEIDDIQDTNDQITSDEDEFTLDDELDYYEEHIKKMWELIVVPYLNDYNNREILYNLNERDMYKFNKFVLDNNKYMEELVIDIIKNNNGDINLSNDILKETSL